MKPILRVLNGEKLETVPIWLMRQAGRYLPEYREIRQKTGSFLDLCYSPELASEITLQPIRRFGFDAAILFSDILVLPDALGQEVWFEEGVGPRLKPITLSVTLAANALEQFTSGQNHKLNAVYDAIRDILPKLGGDCALIGFAGAPWTVATYMIEGGTTRSFEKIRLWAVNQPNEFKTLIDLLVEATSFHLMGQIEAGVEAVQIFDSHAGVLDVFGFEKWVIEPTRAIVKNVRARFPNIPIIGFPRGAGVRLLEYVEKTGVQAVGLDQTLALEWVSKNIQTRIPVQGNLDPIYLLSDKDSILRQTQKVLLELSGGPHIF
ncbi:MAG: uroporphyrinogen decarboxylase, partial [Proteobacteria bacterium]|nr:uroporphyrinogen decarboxylase [Pseudomonadota bacterium]